MVSMRGYRDGWLFVCGKMFWERVFSTINEGDNFMKKNFFDLLEAAGSLPIDERDELAALLQKRTIEERRL